MQGQHRLQLQEEEKYTRFTQTLLSTFSVYHIGITRLGIVHVTCGVLTLTLGSALLWITKFSVWATLVVGAAVLFASTGLLVISRRLKSPICQLSFTLLLPVVAGLAAFLVVVLAGFSINDIKVDFKNIFPDNRIEQTGKVAMLVMLWLLLLTSACEWITCLCTAYMVLGGTCRGVLDNRDRVYTIPYEDTQDLDEAEARGPDIIPSSGSRPILELAWPAGLSTPDGSPDQRHCRPQLDPDIFLMPD